MVTRRQFTTGLFAVALSPSLSRAVAASPATPDASPTAGARQISVYFLRKGRRASLVGAAHRMTDASTKSDVAMDALVALIQGPNDAETAAGLLSDIPAGTKVRGVTFDAPTKLAVVDLTSPFVPEGGDVPVTAMAQVVYTLTQFPEVEHVSIAVEGKPIRLLDGDGQAIDGPAARATYDHVTPLIFLESPAPGDTIASPVHLWGTADTFEGTFTAEIQNADGERLIARMVTATSGNGVRGTFDVSLTFDPGGATAGNVLVYELAERGAADTRVTIPVRFETS